MELSELRAQIDRLDRQLIELLERRMDVAAGIAAYKLAHGRPVLDTDRETRKIEAVKALCRPETATLIGGVFEDIMTASRAYQTSIMESEHGK